MPMDSAMFENIVNNFLKDTEKRTKKENTVFLPGGEHHGRFLMDSSSPVRFYRRLCVHAFKHNNLFVRELCPDFLAEEDEENADQYPICGFCTLAEQYPNFYIFKRAFKTLAYYYLSGTNRANQNFKPGNLYCLIGKSSLATAIDRLMKTWSAKPSLRETLRKSMSWDEAGNTVTLTVVPGSKGVPEAVNAAMIPVELDALQIDPATDLRPLDEAWVPVKFNKASYERSLLALQRELNKDLVVEEDGVIVVKGDGGGGGAGGSGGSSGTNNIMAPSAMEKTEGTNTGVAGTTGGVVNGVVNGASGSNSGKIVLPFPDGFTPPVGCPGYGYYNPRLIGEDGTNTCLLCDEFLSCFEQQKKHGIVVD